MALTARIRRSACGTAIESLHEASPSAPITTRKRKPPYAGVFRLLGVAEAADEGDHFEFGLGFAAGECSACGTVAEPGTCPKCSGDVPAPHGLNEATTARRETLVSLRAEAEAALEALDDLPEPQIPIAPTVLLSGFREADLFTRVLDVIGLGRELARLDLDDPEVIRGPLLTAVRQRLEVVEAIVSVCHDISLFRAAPPADRLPGIATGLARQAARLLIAFSAALTAVDLDAARDAQTAIQAELEGVPSAEQLEEVLGELRDIATGTDQRVGVALARESSFTDAYGAIDLARVFWAYRGAGDPFLAVGRRAAKYFEPLLSVELDVEDIPHAALLALPLLQVVAMDHPLVAHRLTRETHELFRAAVAADRDAVDAVRRDLATRGDALLAAHERSRTAALELSDLPMNSTTPYSTACSRSTETPRMTCGSRTSTCSTGLRKSRTRMLRPRRGRCAPRSSRCCSSGPPCSRGRWSMRSCTCCTSRPGTAGASTTSPQNSTA